MYKLKLTEVILDVYLGVYDFEQVQLQQVKLDLIISYHKAPTACMSDDLNETICYATINELLLKTARQKRYQLIEHLAQSLLNALKNMLKAHEVDIYLELHKKPPLDNVALASFCVEHICAR
ncbi:dihydroneopterin aldolase [Cysteiniphilum halobium]|uniref:dihydroneopterin aldolase n=1 Tax=Cysteiniphilum halobium TaxID=2219059 RepID=UPI000E65150B|nr:dihydroneopterin aldolase [Cysteiniphilum halobium]